MVDKTIITAVLVDENTNISFVEICHQYHIPEELLQEMIEYGFFGQTTASIDTITFDNQMLKRILSARRLQQDLALNIPGIILALELIEELTQVRDELAILQRHIDSPRKSS